MSATLALTHPSQSMIPAHVMAALPAACSDKVRLLKTLMVQCNALRHGGRREGYQSIADAAGMDGEVLRKYHYAWKKQGETALIDHKLCKGRCGKASCMNAGKLAALPRELIQEWHRRCVEHRAMSATVTETRNIRQVWKGLVRDLCKGVALPGVGTWREVWRSQNAAGALPAACPYHEKRVPHGWSYQNFLLHKPPVRARVAAQSGIADVLPMIAPVRIDWSVIRPQEFLIFDDHRTDFLVSGEYEGEMQVAELWVLFLMDASTRTIRWAQAHPKWTRKDGTRVGITKRDARHCLVHYFATHGVPKHWDTTVVLENATASVTEADRDAFARVSGGKIHLRTTGLHSGTVLLSSFGEATGGNPRGMKGALESFWKQLDLGLGHVRGQIGNHYDRKPGDLERLTARTRAIIRKFDKVATAEQMAHLIDLASVPEAKREILDCLDFIERRTDHELVGFESKKLWRWSEHSEKWMSVTGPEMADWLSKAGVEIVNKHLADPAMCMTRMESPREKWERTRRGEDFAALPPDALFELWCDRVRVPKYAGNGCVRVSLGAREFLFEGTRHSAREGQPMEIAFDADDPTLGAALFLPDGGYIGRMDYAGRIDPRDREALERKLGEFNLDLTRVIKEARVIAEPRHVLEDRIQQTADRVMMVHDLEALKDTIAPAPASSRKLRELAEARDCDGYDVPPVDLEDELAKEERRRAIEAGR